MEQRKLVAFGNSSYIVSLPKQWITKNRLEKGDAIRMDEKDNELVISLNDGDERRKFNELTIEVSGKTIDQLKTEIISAYINNCDIITIQGARNENSAKIKEVLQGLVGIEVVEENSTKIMVKDLLDIKEVSVDNLVRRVDTIIRSMLDDLGSTDSDIYGNLVERDKEINRMVLLGQRVVRAAFDNPRVTKMFNTTCFDLLISRQILLNLERFADEIKRVSRNYKTYGTKSKKSAEIRKLYDAVRAEYLETMKIYYSKNKNAAYKKGAEIKDLFKLCDAALEKNNTVECAKLLEHFKYMIGAITSIIRSTMEHE